MGASGKDALTLVRIIGLVLVLLVSGYTMYATGVGAELGIFPAPDALDPQNVLNGSNAPETPETGGFGGGNESNDSSEEGAEEATTEADSSGGDSEDEESTANPGEDGGDGSNSGGDETAPQGGGNDSQSRIATQEAGSEDETEWLLDSYRQAPPTLFRRLVLPR